METKTTGFFALLDSQCRGPSKDDVVAFHQQLFKKHGTNSTISDAKKQGAGNWRGVKAKSSKKGKSKKARFSGFVITHFADDVCYNAAEFLKKNAESVHSGNYPL